MCFIQKTYDYIRSLYLFSLFIDYLFAGLTSFSVEYNRD